MALSDWSEARYTRAELEQTTEAFAREIRRLEEREANRERELRDVFAGQALAGICGQQNIHGVDGYAREAYAIADAMLAARKVTL